MGVDYSVWIIPKKRMFRPRADQIAALANGLRDNKWVPLPESEGQKSLASVLLPGGEPSAKRPQRSEPLPSDPLSARWVQSLSDNELVLDWWVNDANLAGVRFPFNFLPYPESGATYFGVRVLLGHEYFYCTGENVVPFADSDTQCQCGEQLAYWTSYAAVVPSQRIHHQCPTCGRIFDLSAISCKILDGWTGEPNPLKGGLAFRFGLQFDCHKNFPP